MESRNPVAILVEISSSPATAISKSSADILEEEQKILQLKMMKLRNKWVNHQTVDDSDAHGINGEDNQVKSKVAVGNVVSDAHVLFDKLPEQELFSRTHIDGKIGNAHWDLDLKKLQTPLYVEFYNSLNAAGSPSATGIENKENLTNNLRYESDQTMPEVQPTKPSEWKELPLDAPEELICPRFGACFKQLSGKGKLDDSKATKQIVALLSALLDKYNDIETSLKLTNYPCVMERLDGGTNKVMASVIIQSVMKNRTSISTADKVEALFELIKGLIKDLDETAHDEIDVDDFNEEQNSVSSLIQMLYNDDPKRC
ncbi:hypothetical protein U1Q18_017700 [Sarracenia purpurea var. burkii]